MARHSFFKNSGPRAPKASAKTPAAPPIQTPAPAKAPIGRSPLLPGARPRAAKGKRRPRRGRLAFSVLVGLATAAVIFFIWARSQGELSVTENAAGSLIAPIEGALGGAIDWGRDWVHDLRNRAGLRAELEEAQLTIETLKYRVSQLEEASAENQRLNELLDAKSRYQAVDPVYARVIARAPGAWFDVFTVNRGTLDGVDTNMAVITGDALVGHVFEVGLNYAKVRTIIDARSAVAGLIERTRYNGVMRGQLGADSENPRLHMYYMASTSDVRPGDRVLTSGEDELFPKGIPVGTVQEVSRRSDEADQYVVVAPLADFTRLEEVLVLRQLAEAADNQPLPRLPDPTPRPLPSASPSPEGSLAPGEVTPTPVPSGDLWSFPTVMPTSDMPSEINGATQAPTPSTTPAPTPGIPEDMWAEGR
ncbi:MAG: rod shape-determining protein MreC [Clostridiales bacterium]|nr:rod shape-determining protein MreC [Clostridiales bacterium]